MHFDGMEITVLTKADGPLTKHISLNGSEVKSDGSACVMSRALARLMQAADIQHLATLIEGLQSSQAIALGAMRPDLPDEVEVTTKKQLNGEARPDLIARTGSNILYREKQPAPVLLDFDQKGMPPEVRERINELGRFWRAVCAVMPELEGSAGVTRLSTSAGLFRTDTGEHFEFSGGVHQYVIVQDGSDADRFLKTLHERSWLHGLGWFMVGAGGQLLDRSIVDRMVGMPERLVFEGAPVLEPPLAQDAAARKPLATEGETIDTVAICSPLTIVEKATLQKLKAEAAVRLLPERNKARDSFISKRAKELAERTGQTEKQARRVVERQCEGVLLPDVALPFDEAELAGVTVGDVLKDPARFEGQTLADPIEGIEYGRCKAKIMRRTDGTPWIRSFAHGLTTYELKFDAKTAQEEILKADDPVGALVSYVLSSDLDEVTLQRLLQAVAKQTGTGLRVLQSLVREAGKKQQREHKLEERERQLAEDKDPRPRLTAPRADAPYLPIIQAIDEVFMRVPLNRRARRSLAHELVKVVKKQFRDMHGLVSETAAEAGAQLPAPEQWAIVPMGDIGASEEIERYINFVDRQGEPVHLGPQFVRYIWVGQQFLATKIHEAL